jgi:hypothetical protein
MHVINGTVSVHSAYWKRAVSVCNGSNTYKSTLYPNRLYNALKKAPQSKVLFESVRGKRSLECGRLELKRLHV